MTDTPVPVASQPSPPTPHPQSQSQSKYEPHPQPQSEPQPQPQSEPLPQPQSRPHSQSYLPNRRALALGIALALTATDPTNLGTRGPVGWLLTAAAVVAAIWAAPVVVQRPATETVHWNSQLARHRNTVFAMGCTIVAGFDDPPIWLMAVDAALLLAYLLMVDAVAAGPIGIRQLRRAVAPSAAALASAVTLLGARAPVDSGAVWGRVVAAVAVTAAALAAGAALWIRRHPGTQDSDSTRQASNTAPRHR